MSSSSELKSEYDEEEKKKMKEKKERRRKKRKNNKNISFHTYCESQRECLMLVQTRNAHTADDLDSTLLLLFVVAAKVKYMYI
jgi:hypothetical protein